MNGARIYFTIPILGGIDITETLIGSWVIVCLLGIAFWFLGRNLKIRPEGKRQLAAEKLVGMLNNLIDDTMGPGMRRFAPYIGALFCFSLFNNLSSLVGAKPATSDLSVTLAMALATTCIVYYNGFKKNGVLGHLKGTFLEPVPFIAPLNLVSELATPVSMAFRHYGNIASGGVITSLIYTALASASTAILDIGIPFLQVGIPAVLSIYFDLFTGFLQAYIFCMLTMVFTSNAVND